MLEKSSYTKGSLAHLSLPELLAQGIEGLVNPLAKMYSHLILKKTLLMLRRTLKFFLIMQNAAVNMFSSHVCHVWYHRQIFRMYLSRTKTFVNFGPSIGTDWD